MKIVAWQARIHWIQLLWPSIASIFFVLIAVLLFSGAMSPHGSVGGTGILAVGALLFLVAALLVAGFAFVSWQSRRVILTDKKLRVISGSFKQRTADIFLNTIESVVVQQGVVGRMLGFGTVILRDRDEIGHRLKKIAQPTKCLWKLQELLGQRRDLTCPHCKSKNSVAIKRGVSEVEQADIKCVYCQKSWEQVFNEDVW